MKKCFKHDKVFQAVNCPAAGTEDEKLVK